MSIEARFWSRVVVGGPEDCWLWTGFTDKDGYGQYKTDLKVEYTHRYAYRLKNGEIPTDACVMHSCDTPACCNPAHLSTGSQQDNITDKVNKTRQARGSQHGLTRFTEQDVRDIRTSSLPQRVLAHKYGVSQATIWNVKHKIVWGHVE